MISKKNHEELNILLEYAKTNNVNKNLISKLEFTIDCLSDSDSSQTDDPNEREIENIDIEDSWHIPLSTPFPEIQLPQDVKMNDEELAFSHLTTRSDCEKEERCFRERIFFKQRWNQKIEIRSQLIDLVFYKCQNDSAKLERFFDVLSYGMNIVTCIEEDEGSPPDFVNFIQVKNPFLLFKRILYLIISDEIWEKLSNKSKIGEILSLLLGERPIYTVNNWMNCMHSFLKEIGEKYSIHQRIRILERMHLIIPHLYRFGEFKTWMHYFILVDFLKKRNAYRPRERPEYSKTQDNIRFPSTEFYDYYIENHKTIRQETNTADVKTFIVNLRTEFMCISIDAIEEIRASTERSNIYDPDLAIGVCLSCHNICRIHYCAQDGFKNIHRETSIAWKNGSEILEMTAAQTILDRIIEMMDKYREFHGGKDQKKKKRKSEVVGTKRKNSLTQQSMSKFLKK